MFPLAAWLAAGCGFDGSGVGADFGDSGVDPSGDGASSEGHDGGASTADAGPGDAGPRLGPSPLELGAASDLAAAGSYVLLAKTGITNAGGSSISGGHLGLSPAGATSLTGFALVADPSTEFSTSASVVPPAKVYVAGYGGSTPAHLTVAVLGMQAAYTDGAGRMNPDFIELGSGELGGLTLVPGLYKWATGVRITDDVTLSGGPDDVWIFQIASSLDLGTGQRILLAGGAQAKNVYWVVAGEVTIFVNAHFEGVILGKTGITLQTTATMHGRVLAQSLVALDDNAITAP